MGSNIGFWDRVMRPDEVELDKWKKKQEYIDPYERMMAYEALKEPGVTFENSDNPQLQAIEAKFRQKMLKTGGPSFRTKTDESGKTVGYSPRKKQGEEGDVFSQQADNRGKVSLTDDGFEFEGMGGSYKDKMFNMIQKKRRMKSQGSPVKISRAEENFEKDYLNIKDTATGPTSAKDWEDTLARADDIIKARRIQRRMGEMEASGKGTFEREAEVDLMNKQPLTFDESVQGMREALEFRYPNMPQEKIDEAVAKWETKNESRFVDEIGNIIPEKFKTATQIYNFLVDSGMDEESAKMWLQERM